MSSLSLDWHGDFKFAGAPGSPAIHLDSGDPGVISPMQALAYAAMACMAMDVVLILKKGRHEMTGLKVHFDGERAADHPKRYTAMNIRFEVTGKVPEEAVERALQMSRQKYCSVSNSLRPDIDFTTTFTITT
jgi:putative redox protein